MAPVDGGAGGDRHGGRRTPGDGHPRSGHAVDFIAIEIVHVAESAIASQQPDLIQVNQGRAAKPLLVCARIRRGEGLMLGVDHSMLVGRPLRRERQLVRGGTEPEDHHAALDQGVTITVAPQLPAEQVQTAPQAAGSPRALISARCQRNIPEERIAEIGADTEPVHGIGDDVRRMDGSCFQETCRSVAQHLQAAEQRRGVLVLILDVVPPLLVDVEGDSELHRVRERAARRIHQMDMGIDETGMNHATRGIDLTFGPEIACDVLAAADTADFSTVDGDRAPREDLAPRVHRDDVAVVDDGVDRCLCHSMLSHCEAPLPEKGPASRRDRSELATRAPLEKSISSRQSALSTGMPWVIALTSAWSGGTDASPISIQSYPPLRGHRRVAPDAGPAFSGSAQATMTSPRSVRCGQRTVWLTMPEAPAAAVARALASPCLQHVPIAVSTRWWRSATSVRARSAASTVPEAKRASIGAGFSCSKPPAGAMATRVETPRRRPCSTMHGRTGRQVTLRQRSTPPPRSRACAEGKSSRVGPIMRPDPPSASRTVSDGLSSSTFKDRAANNSGVRRIWSMQQTPRCS